MTKEKKYLYVAIFIIVCLLIHQQGLNKKIERREAVIEDCSSQINDANDLIDEANDTIENAQSAAWSDYDDMGYALDDLSTVDIIDNNCFVPR